MGLFGIQVRVHDQENPQWELKQEPGAGTELKQRSCRAVVYWLDFHDLFRLFFLYNPEHLPRRGTAQGKLDLPSSTVNQENTQRLVYSPI